jgi:hypothetical protein
MTSRTFRPTNSPAASYPNSRAAAGLAVSIMPRSSAVMMPSTADSTTARSRADASRRGARAAAMRTRIGAFA